MYEIKIKKYLPITLKVDNFFKINTKIKLKLFLRHSIPNSIQNFNVQGQSLRALLPKRSEVSLVDVVHDDGGNGHDLS